MKKIVVCIIGGGSQGHIAAGVISSNENFQVNILTRKPNLWKKLIEVVDLEGNKYKGAIHSISAIPEKVIPQSDIILICLPGYALKEVLHQIKEAIGDDTLIGCMFAGTGFFLMAKEILGSNASLFGFQRVPFTGRVKEYGSNATLKGYKKSLKVATYNIEKRDWLAETLQAMFNTPVSLLNHFLEATLSNSNPILHPSRMYILYNSWEEGMFYQKVPYFYNTDWDDESSELWLACDVELQKIIRNLPIPINGVPSLLEYYECGDAKELTQKISSIKPFKEVRPPMIQSKEGFIPNVSHRYFTEDVAYGLVLIKSIALVVGVEIPTIDKILKWGQKMMNKEYLVENKLTGKDIHDSGFVSTLNI